MRKITRALDAGTSDIGTIPKPIWKVLASIDASYKVLPRDSVVHRKVRRSGGRRRGIWYHHLSHFRCRLWCRGNTLGSVKSGR